MNAVVVLIAMAAAGVDVGWRPLDEGGFEYIIQIEPEMLESLRQGQAIQSDLPPFLQDIRSYRIVVGNDDLPREDPDPRGADSNRVAGETDEPAAEDIADLPGSGNEELSGQETFTYPPGASPSEQQYSMDSGEATDNEAAESDSTRSDIAQAEDPTPRQDMPPLHAKKSIKPPRAAAKDRRSDAPRAFVADAESKPVVNQAGYRDRIAASEPEIRPTIANRPESSGAIDGEAAVSSQSEKPWWPLTLTLLGLFASMGGNFYLGWVTWDVRGRYRRLLQDFKLKRPANEPA